MASWPGAALGFGDGLDEVALGPEELAYRAFAQVADAHATTVRFPLRWDLVERGPGSFDWSRYEPLHRQLTWHGLSALPVIVGAPNWLDRGEAKSSGGGLRYPVGGRALNALGEFVVATIRYFTAVDDCIDAVEIWNEPNSISATDIEDPAEFLRMVSTAAMHIAVENQTGAYAKPKTAVAGGLSMRPEDKPWGQYLRGQHPDYFTHAIAIHSHPSPGSKGQSPAEYAERSAAEVVGAVEQVAAAIDGEVWVTSTGATSDGSWGEDGQAEALRSLTSALAGLDRCRGMIVSPLVAGTGDISGTADSDASLLNQDGTAKAALSELRSAWAQAR